MRLSSSIVGLFFLCLSFESIACSCDGSEPFVAVYKKASFVGLVKVVSHSSSLSMEIEVIDVYKGAETRKALTIWGDNGILCRPYVSQFTDGEYFVMALYAGTPKSGNKGENASDYYISVCGTHWLSVDYNKQRVKGYIAKAKHSMTLDRLKTKLTGG